MSNKSIIEFPKKDNDRIVLKDGDFQQIAPTVKRIVEEGWTKITLSGSKEMCQSAWFESKMAGLDVLGYTPTSIDRRKLEDMKLERKAGGILQMTGNEVANDYSLKVIPKLHTRFEDLKKKKLQFNTSTSKLNEFSSSSTSTTLFTDIEEQFNSARRVLSKAMEELEFFSRVGNRRVNAVQRFEDGIARFTVSQEERNRLLGIRPEKSLLRSRV
ncbi:MAG TPA: hypothetical protein PKA63_12605 [Oligoflexia bacterium]|nr:hypothetical protein [Oligoflexia bacterium]